jgi:peptide/nickel transport system ATP-binding protein
MAETLITIDGLKKHYPVESSLLTQLLGEQRYVHAVDGIGFDIDRGEIFGLAGESGCGKTTTGRCLARLTDPTEGEIRFGPERRDIADLSGAELREYRRKVQVVFQDPFGSINDRFRVRSWVGEPLEIHDIGTRNDREERIVDTLEQCGLRPAEEFLDQFPHELSGGQRQRVALARAMVLNPSFLVADEPTSMLDVSVRASVLSVFKRLVEEEGVTILYISHDLSLLRYICDRIGIMYQGELMEVGPASDVLQQPRHPYTQSLLSAVPRIDPLEDRDRVRIPPDVEEQIGGVEGCPFKSRCPHQFGRCDEELEPLEPDDETDQLVACHLYEPDVDRDLPEYEP